MVNHCFNLFWLSGKLSMLKCRRILRKKEGGHLFFISEHNLTLPSRTWFYCWSDGGVLWLLSTYGGKQEHGIKVRQVYSTISNNQLAEFILSILQQNQIQEKNQQRVYCKHRGILSNANVFETLFGLQILKRKTFFSTNPTSQQDFKYA